MHALDIGSLIAFHRKKAGLTQIELAKLSGVSRFVVQDIEAGSGRTTWKHLVSVLNSLNVELEPKGPLVDAWQAHRKAPE
jgi:HTH-type transcriptional regulator / antitoxin HipB